MRVGGALGAVVVVALLAGTWSLWSVSRDVRSAQEQASILRADLVRGDAPGARRSLRALQDDADGARGRTDGLVWAAMSRLPGVGDGLGAIKEAADVLADIAERGLPPVVEAADVVSADTFRPRDGRLPVEAALSLAEPVERSRAVFDAAARRLSRVDTSGLSSSLRLRFEDFADLVDTTTSALDSTARAARLLPSVLGTEGERRYLLVLQNNAELRSGGGLPGALTLVTTDRGRFEIAGQGDTADLGRASVVRLDAAERAVFGDLLAEVPVDATLTPDAPRSAQIMKARWERAGRGRLDGVVFIDPVAVSYLLQGTGPVQVPGYPAVDASNLVASVENAIYLSSLDRAVHSAYQQAVASAVFGAFTSGVGDTPTVIAGLVRAVQEGRIRMHSFDAADQQQIAGTRIAGELSATDASPRVGVYLNDAGPSKLNYYLEYQGEVFSRSCRGGRQVITGSVDLVADTPPDVATLPASITGAGEPGQRAATPGDQLITAYVVAPAGGDFTRLRLDGRVLGPLTVTLGGRRLAVVGMAFAPQQRHRLQFELTGGPGQTGDVRLEVTPRAQPGDAGDVGISACSPQ